MSFALITAILTMAFALFGRPASGGEIVDCVEAPGSGRWVYRIIDERQCWFPAGRLRRGEEKPREELRWPKPITADPLPDGFEGWMGSQGMRPPAALLDGIGRPRAGVAQSEGDRAAMHPVRRGG